MNRNSRSAFAPFHHVVASANSGNCKSLRLKKRNHFRPSKPWQLGMNGVAQFQVNLPQGTGLVQPAKRIFQAIGFRIRPQRFPQIRNCLIFGIALAISRDVRNPRGKSAMIKVRD